MPPRLHTSLSGNQVQLQMTIHPLYSLDVLPEIPLHELECDAPPVVHLADQDGLYRYADLINAKAAALYDASEYAQRNGTDRRLAYVTLATPEYDLGLRVLIRSIRRVSDIPIFVLVTSKWKVKSEARDVFGLAVPGIARADNHRSRSEFGATYTKLWPFALRHFDRVVFIDSDMLVLGDLDHLWTGSQFMVCRDSVEASRMDRFNSGLLAFTPKDYYLNRIAREGPHAPSDDGGDQGLLNSLFSSDVKYIESEYNTIKHYWYFNAPEVDRERIKCIHFIVKKPWELWYRELTDCFTVDIEDKWTRFLTHQELLSLVSHWRRRQFLAERPRFDITRQSKSGKRDRRKRRLHAAALAVSLSLLPLAYFLGRFVG